MDAKTYSLEHRRRVLVNADPAGRCYWGVFPSSEYVWTPWEVLRESDSVADLNHSAAVFKEINPAREYRVVSNSENNDAL